MFKNILSRKALLPLVAGVVIGATVGGIGMVVATPNTITACADKRTGTMRYVANGKCNTRTENKVEWNQTGPAGATGATGTGIDGGLRFTFSTTVTDVDPGTGVIRYNSATVTSVTNLFVDLTDVNGTSVMAILDSFSTANGGGTIWLTGKTSNQVNAFTVNGVLTDGSGYRKIPVVHVSGSLPTNGEQLVMTFGRRGAQGPQGERGAQGPEGEEGERGPTGATGATFADATAVALTADATLTATQIISSRLFTFNGAGASTLTSATAALILAEMSGEAVGDTFEIVIVNIDSDSGHTATLAAAGGSGITIVGSAVVAINSSATFIGRVDSTTAITFYRA
jgi:hypothetical protein